MKLSKDELKIVSNNLEDFMDCIVEPVESEVKKWLEKKKEWTKEHKIEILEKRVEELEMDRSQSGWCFQHSPITGEDVTSKQNLGSIFPPF